ncbi:hypothetical protein PIB30_058856 [Stylosanthes scabra]|uniref:Uncharacterized protein n=1 Tax=Stylosanthes scabra TaxID=79078 RepID=A0ABU6QJI9_9FABA|nr:hypothetical protein [Stylosanthes scabra]
MDRKGKQVTSNKNEKMRTPPTRASPRLAVLRAPLAIPSPPAALQPQEILPTNQENSEATNTEIPRTTNIRKTARILLKPIQGSPTTEEVGTEEDPEELHKEEEEEDEDPEELPKEESQDLWDLIEPSTSSSEQGYDKGDDPYFSNYDGDLFDWQNVEPSEGSIGSCTGPPPAGK